MPCKWNQFQLACWSGESINSLIILPWWEFHAILGVDTANHSGTTRLSDTRSGHISLSWFWLKTFKKNCTNFSLEWILISDLLRFLFYSLQKRCKIAAGNGEGGVPVSVIPCWQCRGCGLRQQSNRWHFHYMVVSHFEGRKIISVFTHSRHWLLKCISLIKGKHCLWEGLAGTTPSFSLPHTFLPGSLISGTN